jgi:hypothetical protein
MEELKKKSKETYKINEENDYLYQFNDELNKLTIVNISENENKVKNYNIYFYLSLDKENSFIFPIKSEYFKIKKQKILLNKLIIKI